MIKKIVLTLITLLTLVGCSYKAPENTENITSSENSELSLEDIRSAMNSNQLKDGTVEEILAEIEGEEAEAHVIGTDEIDVDLTVLSSTLVASQVYDMLSYPEAYTGDVVKMAGQFTYFLDINTNKKYYSCLVADAAECCETGIEFTWEAFDDPANLPEDLSNIEVIGALRTYQDGNFKYVTIDATSVEIK